MQNQIGPAEATQQARNTSLLQQGFSWHGMRTALLPVELWLQWQAEVLKAAAPATADWMARRREETEATLSAVQQLCACEDPKEAARIQKEWVADEIRRVEADIASFTSPATFWPQVAIDAGRKTARMMLEA